MEARKQAIMQALDRFVAQRPGLEFGNYGDAAAYRSEMRRITKDRHDYNVLARAVERSDSITADMLVKASESAFSGRLTITEERYHSKSQQAAYEATRARGGIHEMPAPDAERVRIAYTTGQYFPTEYRKAACAVLASALWRWARENCMPSAEYIQHGSADNLPMSTEAVYGPREMSAGDWLRAYFRREFGRGIASRWLS